MERMYLINYSVKGIKSLDDWARLSFYKKSFTSDLNMRDYCIKGIYGVNGSGKSAIVASVDILRRVITYRDIFNETVFQKELRELVNKKLGSLEYDIVFLYVNSKKNSLTLYRYQLLVGKNSSGKFVVLGETLSSKAARSHNDNYSKVFETENGEISFIKADGEIKEQFISRTKNILYNSTLSSIIIDYVLSLIIEGSEEKTLYDCVSLLLFGMNLYAYMDTSDDHTEYIMNNMTNEERLSEYESKKGINGLGKSTAFNLYNLSPKRMYIPKQLFGFFEKRVELLGGFLKIFKPELSRVIIDKRDYSEIIYSADLIMDYGDYTVNAEFESTGIKKLIKLYSFFQHMINGNIVFIDELDSNLHDVYLCALLEYLMEYGNGQLCFTTHNIGPMDVLKRNKKSIDFLSVNHNVYPWVTNGNYSPSKLYKNGMIEGSPFNVDAIDFLSVFESNEDM